MKLARFLTLSTFFALVTTPSLRAQSNADAAVQRAVDAYAKMTTLRATFMQTLTNPLTGTTATARGELAQQGTRKFAVRFTEPSGDAIVSDGTWLWIYLPSSQPGQVIKTRATEDAGIPDFTTNFLKAKERYDITPAGTAVIEGHATTAVQLIPKSPNGARFTKAMVWIDDRDGLVRQFELAEPSGIMRRVTISKVNPNAALGRDAFTFVPPSGVKVFDQTKSGD
jgi:outer membrane lipoprotein carrier protein